MYKNFIITNRPGYGCIKAPKTMTVVRTTPGLNAFRLDIPGTPGEPLMHSRFYFLDTDREEFYRKVSWSQLMNKEEAEFRDHQWNYVALRALLLTLAATHHKEFSEFTLDMQNDRWWHDSEPLDAEPCGPHVPRVTDAPRRPRKPSSSSSIAKFTASGSPTCEPSAPGAMRPRALFRTSRLSEEPRESLARPGSYQRPHKIANGDTACDGCTHFGLTLPEDYPTIGHIILGPCDCDEQQGNDSGSACGLPLDPMWPISPMSPVLEEPTTPIYV